MEHFVETCRLNFLGLVDIFTNVKSRVLRPKPRDVSEDYSLQGKLCVCTGSNTGIGLATAEALVRRGVHTILACRNVEKAEKAAEYLRSLQPLPGFTAGAVEVARVDLACLNSVRSFARQCTQHIDFVICNAGVMAPPTRILTVDGLELQFQTNVLSQWLLTLLLFQKERQRRANEKLNPRLSNVRFVFLTSLTHFAGRLHFDDLQAEHAYSPFQQYAATKLACILLAKEMNRRLKDSDDMAVAVHPGIVDTALSRQFFLQHVPSRVRAWVRPFLETVVFPLLLRTPEEAAETVLYSCTGMDIGGKYIADGKIGRCSDAARDFEKDALRLWTICAQLASIPADSIMPP